MGLDPLKTKASSLMPVSYTHLDVYKRQEFAIVGARIEIISNAPKIIKLQLTLCLQQLGSPFPSLLDGFA